MEDNLTNEEPNNEKMNVLQNDEDFERNEKIEKKPEKLVARTRERKDSYTDSNRQTFETKPIQAKKNFRPNLNLNKNFNS
jgi:hypothetical protein